MEAGFSTDLAVRWESARVKKEPERAPTMRGPATAAQMEVQMGEFTVTGLEELGDRELAAYDVNGNRIAIAKVGDAFYAFGDTCTHLGCSLAEGQLEGTTVTCPCHGSEFNVTTGEVVHGPASEPVRSYPVQLANGELRVEA
jgi:nitrite reductase/ring-hydroxylating ferredoxin subunit